MSAEDRVDAIVVGAGPAGSVAALQMARAGLEVILLERGKEPGSKNTWGGRLYTHVLQRLIPEFQEDAPLERRVTNEKVTFMTGESATTLDFRSTHFREETRQSYTVLRADFDRWLATKAEEAGAFVLSGVRVDELIREDGRVVGVRAGDDEMLANVVIAADGVHSRLAQAAGLRGQVAPADASLGVKEMIELPREVIESRFGLEPDEGVAQLFVGEATAGMPGGGFLYTNRSTISLGLVIGVEPLAHASRSVPDLVEAFRAHPAIAPLVDGGTVVEYSAHLVPEGGWRMIPKLVSDGLLVVGDAAGFVINRGLQLRGMDLAMESGALAAATCVEAKASGDFSAAGLASYQRRLREGFVLPDLRTFRGAPAVMESPRIFQRYPGLAEQLFLDIFSVDGNRSRHLFTDARRAVSSVGLGGLISDGWKAVRSL